VIEETPVVEMQEVEEEGGIEIEAIGTEIEGGTGTKAEIEAAEIGTETEEAGTVIDREAVTVRTETAPVAEIVRTETVPAAVTVRTETRMVKTRAAAETEGTAAPVRTETGEIRTGTPRTGREIEEGMLTVRTSRILIETETASATATPETDPATEIN
jgi:hypothetical protein